MSCWVVPTVAAELWGVAVDDVQSRIREGSVPSKEENGFTFIDVAPDSPVLVTPKQRRLRPPPTYRVVTREEILALIGSLPEAQFDYDEAADQADVEQWRLGRSEASRIRKPPETVAA